MRAFWIVVSLCVVESIALALLLGGARSPTLAAAAPRPAGPVRVAAPTPTPAFTLVAGGDVALAGEPTSALFVHVRRFLHPADLVLANLEGTLATGGSARCVASAAAGCFVFRASPAWAKTLRHSGFTAFNVANNHALDFGSQGQAETLAALRRARLAYTGLPAQIRYVRAGDLRVALVGCAPYRWAQSLLDVAGTQALVRRAASSADVVVVVLHAGAEGSDAAHVTGAAESYRGEPRGNPEQFAHAMVDAGADLVLASGPHVLRGLEWYRGRLVAYSLGNLASSHTLSSAGVLAESVLLRVQLDARGRFLRGSLVPLRLDASGTPSYDPGHASLALVRTLSHEDFGRRGATIATCGRLLPPTRPAGGTCPPRGRR